MHVSIGPILNSTRWRAKRDGTVHDRDTEAEARAIATALAVGGLQIIETSFHDPIITELEPAPAPEPRSMTLVYLPNLLDSSIPNLKATLASGTYDGVLDAAYAAEDKGRHRVGALKAIQARIDEVSADD